MSSIFTKLTGMLVLAGFLVQGYSQSGTVSSGGDGQGVNGSVSYTVGQVFFLTKYGESGTSLEGMQQPYEISTVSISEIGHDFSLNLFPNPTIGLLSLEIGNYQGENLSYHLFNLSGQLTESGRVTDKLTLIQAETFSPGTYFLTLSLDQKAIETFKIIKNN